VPRVSTNAGSWIFQGLVLQPIRGDARRGAVLEEQRFIARNEVGHRAALPDVPM
jgi:hypothetical protein